MARGDGSLIWLWCCYATVGRPIGTVKAVVWTLDSRGGRVAKDQTMVDKMGKYELSRVFAGIEWSKAEQATLRTALSCYVDNVSVSLSQVHLATIELKLALAIDASGYTEKELWQSL